MPYVVGNLGFKFKFKYGQFPWNTVSRKKILNFTDILLRLCISLNRLLETLKLPQLI